MKVQLLGTGVGIPQRGRAQSGLIMEIDEKPILFDCGCGVLQRIFESGYRHTDIDTIVLSHLHLDHVSDVPGLLKANWLCDVLDTTIYGPAGTQRWLDRVFNTYDYMKGKMNIEVKELQPGDSFSIGDTTIRCAAGVHSVPSLGYRVEDEAVVVYSGDTQPCESIMELGKECDLMIHECSFPVDFEVTFHTTPSTLRPLLKNSGIKKLYLTHLYPQMQGKEQEAIDFLKKAFDGEVHIGCDLEVIKLQ